MPLPNRQRLEKNAQIMIKMLPPRIAALAKCPAPPVQPTRPKSLRDVRHSELNADVDFAETPSEGRYAVAKADIAIGEKVLVEHPHCAVLLEKYSQSHCQHCFQRATLPLACPRCADVVFCSAACRKTATESYHKYECGILRILWNSGSSVTCHMAFRAIAQQSVAYFRKIQPELTASLADPIAYGRKVQKLPVGDYRRVWHLVRHETVRSTKSFMNYAAMAYFLTHCLRMADYLASAEDFDFVGSLVLRNLQLMQFNSHEIYELQKDGAKTVFLGGGLYPTLALFNHSCNPGIVR